MKILLVGGSGQVGREITQLFQFHHCLRLITLSRAELDIKSIFSVKFSIEKHKPNIVVNAAAYTNVDLAEDNQAEAFAVNEKGVSNLAKICSALNIPLIHLSTDYVFDGEKKESYSELDIPNPINMYGKSKLDGEKAIVSILEKHIIVRTSWIFSSYRTNFVKKILSLAWHEGPLKIVNDIYGCPTSANDLASFILNLIQIISSGEFSSWGIFHYCGRPVTTWYDYAAEILKQGKSLGVVSQKAEVIPVRAKDFATKAKRPRYAVLDCQKVISQLKVEQPSWKLGLIEVLNELKSNS